MISSYYKVCKYNDSLYQFQDPMGVLSTLVIGDKKALLFDTCYGIGDLKKQVEELTTKELIVVNSHGHMDHSCGNYQFDEVYIHKNDVELLKKHNSRERRRKNLIQAKKMGFLNSEFDEEEYLSRDFGNIKDLPLYTIFDLGNVSCEVLPLFGHTKGSIALYISKWKLMLVSDGSCPFVWIFLEESTTVKEYIESVSKLLTYDFDSFLVGHGARMLDRKRMEDFLMIAKTISLKDSVKVTFQNFEELDSYCYTKDKMFDQDGCGIVFDPKKIE